MHAALFQQQARQAHENFQRTGNRKDYIADVSYLSILAIAAEIASRKPNLKHLETAVTASQHGIKSLASMAYDKVDCPVANDHDHQSFGNHFWDKTKYYAQRDLSRLEDNLLAAKQTIERVFQHL